MTDEWAKATQEVAKASGKAVDAGRGLGSFISEFIKQPLTEQVGIWTDNLRYRRWSNQMALKRKAEAKLAELGYDVPLSDPPMSVLVPLLEAASLAEDEGLHERWVNLLLNFSNAASGVKVQRSFVSVLAALEPLDAHALQVIYSVDQEREGGRAIRTAKLPMAVTFEPIPDGTKHPTSHPEPSDEVMVALGNLARLGLIGSASAWGGVGALSVVDQTPFGREFVRACTLQKATGS